MINSMNHKYLFTYSEQERLAVFLPPKTGTIHATFILNHFNFKTDTYESDSDDDKLISEEDYLIHHHTKFLPKQYVDYDVIYTTRNPYSRLVSMYYHDKKMTEYKSQYTKTFKQYFSDRVNYGWDYVKSEFNFVKTPKYLLRMEHLYYDYTQIPFIRDSKLNESGILYELCEKKIHAKKQDTKTSNEYYTQDMADYVYDSLKPYFDLAGYDKNSWKI
jgi:hypothetical protein